MKSSTQAIPILKAHTKITYLQSGPSFYFLIVHLKNAIDASETVYNDDGAKEWLHFYDGDDFDGGHNDHDRDDDAMQWQKHMWVV